MVPARFPENSSLQPLSPERTATILRAHFIRHNRRALALALVTFAASIAAWFILYGVCCWLIVLFLAAIDRADLGVPRGFGWIFFVTALCMIFYAWIDRRLTPHEQLRDDKSRMEIASDFILVIPRMTLSIFGTLSARQHLSAPELAQAAEFLHRLAEVRRLPMSSVALEIPDPEAARRILFALQITQITETSRDQRDFWIKLNPLRPAALQLGGDAYAHP